MAKRWRLFLFDSVKLRNFERQVAEHQICAAILNYSDGLLPPDTASTWQAGSVNKPVNRNEVSTMEVMRIVIDLAKMVFQVHGVDALEKLVYRSLLRRSQLVEFFTNREPCLIGMEACASVHHWALKLQAMGHTVKLIASQCVKPYVKVHKNDANDVEAICGAVGRPCMRFVPVKTVEQQGLQALCRIRSELIRPRTAKVNQIRGLLSEYDFAVLINAVNLEYLLGEIEPNGSTVHDDTPFSQ